MRDWTLELALEYIRWLQPKAMDKGWCIMLGGGVLNNGVGKDLDLMAYPRTVDSRRCDMIDLLPDFGRVGVWSNVGVADVFQYAFLNGQVVELIFQTHNTCEVS
jgi:hypothetical protein